VVSLRQGEDDDSRGLWDPNQRDEPPQDQGEQLWNLIEVLQRRWLVIVPAMIVVFALNYVGAALSPKLYTATSLVMINPGREQVIEDRQLVNRTYATDVVVESEIEVIASPDVMRRAVEALQLDEDPEWNGALRPPSPLRMALSPLLGEPNTSREEPTVADRDALRERIARHLARNIGVRRREPSYAIEISATSLSARRAAEIANGVASAYLEAQTASQFASTQRANEWLSQRVSELAAEVQAKERAAEEFRVQAGLSLAAGGAEQQQSTEGQTMLAAARADLTEREARLRQVEALIAQGGSADLIAGAANSALITTLRANEAEMQRRQAELEQRYGELHPEVQSGRVELENLRQRIEGEISRITTGLRNEVEISRRRLASLQGNFGAETYTFQGNNDEVIQYRQLLREAQAARTVHQSFLQRFQEVESQTALPMTQARLVSTAAPPGGPSSPDLNAALRTAILLALVIGIGLGFLVEFLDSSIANASEVERKLGVTAIASVPKLKNTEYRTLAPDQHHPAGYLVDKPMSGFAETFRVLRTSIMHARIDNPVRVVAVTSALSDEGKTTVSLCLARIAALSGQRVALIDCDLRRQSVATVLDATPQSGLLDVLMGKMSWRTAINEDEETSAHLLMGPPAAFTPLDLFSSQAMAQLLSDMRGVYDLVIMDCAPVLHVADTRNAASLADLTIMVVKAEKTPATAVRTAIKELQNAGAHLHGVALNCVKPVPIGRGAYSNSLYYGHSKKNKYYAT
jgi:exopolysaccharide transport family protein